MTKTMAKNIVEEAKQSFEELFQMINTFRQTAKQEVEEKCVLIQELQSIKNKSGSDFLNEIKALKEENNELKKQIQSIRSQKSLELNELQKELNSEPKPSMTSDIITPNQLKQQLVDIKTDYEEYIEEMKQFYENKFNWIYDYHQQILKKYEEKTNEIRVHYMQSLIETKQKYKKEIHKREIAYKKLKQNYLQSLEDSEHMKVSQKFDNRTNNLNSVPKSEGLSGVHHKPIQKIGLNSFYSVLHLLKEIKINAGPQWLDEAKRQLCGSIVLTTFNNRIYKIEGIDKEKNVSTYKFMKGDKEITLVDYYKEFLGITIRHLGQPLIECLPSLQTRDYGVGKIYLVPELCQMTGLTDDMRKDFRQKWETSLVINPTKGSQI